jgi:hypothetical protein
MLSHDDEHDFLKNPVDETAPAGFINIWPYGLVKQDSLTGRRFKTDDERQAGGPPERDKRFVSYIFGLDLGRVRDYSSLVIIEPRYVGDVGHYLVRAVARYRLGLPYANIISKTKRVYDKLRDETIRKNTQKFDATIIADATGVGAPIVEALRDKMPYADVRAAIFTAGHEARFDGDTVYAPKALCVSTLLACFESGRIHIPEELRLRGVLFEELQNYELRVSSEGSESFSGRGTTHDDVLSACMLAVFLAERQRPVILF